eukprot:2535704-Prymnesium_polylepis.1
MAAAGGPLPVCVPSVGRTRPSPHAPPVATRTARHHTHRPSPRTARQHTHRPSPRTTHPPSCCTLLE